MTCTVPVVEGSVRTTDATPEEFVVTIRWASDPASVVKKMLAPVAVPPDEPGLRVAESVMFVPCVPLPGSPVFAIVAAGLPTTIQPP